MLLASKPVVGEPSYGKALLGGSPTAFSVRARAARSRNEQFDVIEHCHNLGLAGAEAGQFKATPENIRATRQKVEAYGMVVVLNIPLPKTESDLPQFEIGVAGCKEAGAIAIHAAMTNRRYEQFDSLAAFKANFAQCQKTVEMAEPVLRKHRLPLAIENHKGWRANEQAAWMKRVSSEWVGVCLDMGNNISLCEMPDETFLPLERYGLAGLSRRLSAIGGALW
jgi:sugar phosphate isomerase/epimerase